MIIARIETDKEVYKNFMVRNWEYWEKELEIAFEKIYLIEQAKLNEALEGEKRTDDVISGSGFFINKKGYFVTNYHVVAECNDESKITFKEKDVDAKLIVKDEFLDLALLRAKVKPKSFFIFIC